MRELEAIYSHTFESYDNRLNGQPKSFFSKNDTISSELTKDNWSMKDENLKKRKTQKNFL